MSLDVYLQGPEFTTKCRCVECDNEHSKIDRETFFSANITHNLGKMASEAGIYEGCWRPEEIGITKASELVPILEAGLKAMEADPQRFKAFNASNGWGTYEQFVPWVRNYLHACRENPEATVRASR